MPVRFMIVQSFDMYTVPAASTSTLSVHTPSWYIEIVPAGVTRRTEEFM